MSRSPETASASSPPLDSLLRVALELPAVFANNCIISRAAGGVKVTFLEQATPDVACTRVAVYLPMEFAKDLSGHLTEAIGRFKQMNEQPEERSTTRNN